MSWRVASGWSAAGGAELVLAVGRIDELRLQLVTELVKRLLVVLRNPHGVVEDLEAGGAGCVEVAHLDRRLEQVRWRCRTKWVE